jgi:hypothetical protein
MNWTTWLFGPQPKDGGLKTHDKKKMSERSRYHPTHRQDLPLDQITRRPPEWGDSPTPAAVLRPLVSGTGRRQGRRQPGITITRCEAPAGLTACSMQARSACVALRTANETSVTRMSSLIQKINTCTGSSCERSPVCCQIWPISLAGF